MKKTIFLSLVAIMAIATSCTSTNWGKETAKKGCIDGAIKEAGDSPEAKEMITKLCDCVSEKMITQYKTEADANKDVSGLLKLTTDCQTELYKGIKK